MATALSRKGGVSDLVPPRKMGIGIDRAMLIKEQLQDKDLLIPRMGGELRIASL